MSQNPARTAEIAIAGGGIGGLCAALCFARRGHRVSVLEQAGEVGEVGAGIQLSPNAMHVLCWLGLEQPLHEVACEPLMVSLRHHRSGRAMLQQPLNPMCRQRYGASYLHIHRADLIRVLHDAARDAGVSLYMSRQVIGYRQDGERVLVRCADGNEHEADLLVGADGIHSAVRAQMLGEENPRYTGQVAWRGTVPAAALAGINLPMHAHMWLGPGRHFVAYYLRRGELLNFVAIEERPGVWTEESWNIRGDMDDVRRAFADWDPAIEQILRAGEHCHLWGLFDRDPLPRCSDGSAVLLGDACHPMLPFMAQGGAMAVEDGFVLAQLVSNRKRTGDALREYEALRKPRTSLVQGLSRRNARLFHQRSPLLRLLRRVAFFYAGMRPQVDRLARLYRVNVTANDGTDTA